MCLSPDEWRLALFGTLDIGGDRCDRLEARLLNVAQHTVSLGGDVVVDFGLWARDERTALRWLFGRLGAQVVVEYIDVSRDEQRRRLALRDAGAGWEAAVAADDYGRDLFQVPTEDELTAGPLDVADDKPRPARTGVEARTYVDWAQWAADRWPGLVVADVGPGRTRV